MMKNRIRGELKAEREKIAQKAAKDLLNGRNVDVDRVSRILELYDQLLSIQGKQLGAGLLTGAIAATVCVAIAIALLVFKISNTDVLLYVETGGVQLTLNDNVNQTITPQLVTSKLMLEGFSLLRSSPPLGISVESSDNGSWLYVQKGDATLSKLVFNSANTDNEISRIELNVLESGDIDISMRGLRVNAEVWISGDVDLSWGNRIDREVGRVSRTIEFAERLFASVSEDIATPQTVRFRSSEALFMRNLKVNGIRFGKPKSVTDIMTDFESRIKKARIVIPTVAREVSLAEGETLHLEGLTGQVKQMHIGKSIELELDGKVSSLKIGPTGLERDLMPRYLEYFYHNRPIGLLWSSVVFLWGLILGLRKLLRGL